MCLDGSVFYSPSLFFRFSASMIFLDATLCRRIERENAENVCLCVHNRSQKRSSDIEACCVPLLPETSFLKYIYIFFFLIFGRRWKASPAAFQTVVVPALMGPNFFELLEKSGRERRSDRPVKRLGPQLRRQLAGELRRQRNRSDRWPMTIPLN